MSRLPATEAEFHERYPAPDTIRTADPAMLALSGSKFCADHLVLYRVLEQQHTQPIATSANSAGHAALFAALRMFPRNRALVAAFQYAPAGLVATGGFLNFYSLLAPLLQAGERPSAPAQAVIQRRAQVASTARAPASRLRPGFVTGSELGLSSPAQPQSDHPPSSSPYTPASHVLSTASVQMDRVGPEPMVQHLVSAFLTGVLGMRDDPPLRRLIFLPGPRRMKVDTCGQTFVCVDDGGFAFAVGDDGRRYAGLECKRRWDIWDEWDEEVEGPVQLEETLHVVGQHVAEFLGMVAWKRPNDGEGWEDVHKRFFLVAANQYHLQLKRVDFTPQYLHYVFGERVAQRPARAAWSPPPARRNYRLSSSPTENESASSWGLPSTPGGSSSVNTTPCRRPQTTTTHLDDAEMTDSEQKDDDTSGAQMTDSEQKEDDTDDDAAQHSSPSDHESHRDLPFMTIHSGPIHNLSTPDGRVSAAREILALAEELESWI